MTMNTGSIGAEGAARIDHDDPIMSEPSPPLGAGAIVTPDAAPTVLFHGTNFVSAAAILRSGAIDAEQPVDGEELGDAVCLTSDENMGHSFAIEFLRINSEHPVGAVFSLDGAKVAETQDLFPYHAETAGVFEHEYRATGDLTVEGHVIGVAIVGEVHLLDEDSFLHHVWDGMPSYQRTWFENMDGFRKAVGTLMVRAGRPRIIEADGPDDDRPVRNTD